MVWTLPLVLPLVPAVVSLLVAAGPDSDGGDMVFLLTFIAIPAVAILGASVRAVQSARIGERDSSALLNALGAGAIGVVVGWFLWWQAIDETCHGRYECPF